MTLTYSDATLPRTSQGLPTLDPKDLKNWLKRFRAAIAPLRIRFYAVGEYGGETFRPHYHAAIYNYEMCRNGRTLKDVRTGRPLPQRCCDVCRLVHNTWSVDGEHIGDVDLGELNDESAQYVAGYTTKKMTAADDSRLLGRYPEFARMSLKPGIGAGFVPFIADAINVLSVDLVAEQGDVPSALRHGTRIMPIGRYLRRKLRMEVGLAPEAPQSTLDQAKAELQPLRDRAFENSRSFKKEVLEEYDNKVKSLVNKHNIYKKRSKL